MVFINLAKGSGIDIKRCLNCGNNNDLLIFTLPRTVNVHFDPSNHLAFYFVENVVIVIIWHII